MRIVGRESEIAESLESARREAEKSFGNDSLLLEKFVENARHIEVQIFGDAHGNLVHLFERDCSIQRRHQKIIEESPSPAVDDRRRRLLGEAAIKAGRAIGYINAGTVEFIVSPQGNFYFIEVNTRLQVEHPVTEMTTGIDLVKLQIEVAQGRPLPFAQASLKTSGHAVEARLYAEDPDNAFLPANGKILDWLAPKEIEGMRIDAAVECGMEVGIHYDPLLAKIIAYAEDRPAAIRKLSYALRALSIQGLQTNRQFLIQVLEHPEFLAGNAGTGFIAEQLDRLVKVEDPALDVAALLAVTFYLQQKQREAAPLFDELPPSYRNNPYRNPSIKFELSSREVEVSWSGLSDSVYEAKVFDSAHRVQVVSCDPGSMRLAIDGVQREFRIIESGERFYAHCLLGSRVVHRLPRHPIKQLIVSQGSANSPMPGQVLKILVETGQRVSAGDPLVILEAMKMEHTMRANIDGVVEAVLVTQGEVIGPGQMLVKILPADHADKTDK
jgi:acetyl/propionyl-CoA carboxylase alpha subunit